MITIDYQSKLPLYEQIAKRFQTLILKGALPPDSQMPSVRSLAMDLSINPNTIQKALTELERTGLVYSQRTSGRFITEDAKMIEELKNNLAQEQIKEFLENMSKLGYKKSETLSLIQEILEGEQA